MKTCLIVDDSSVVRRVARRIIEYLDFECHEVGDGAAAYDYCSNDMPDLVILDWNMPIMSGIEFIEKLRTMPNGDKPKVIFCTTESDATHVQRAINAGADEYIMKPFDNEVFTSKLKVIGMIPSDE